MKLAECFNGTKTSYMPRDQGKFDFSCHGLGMVRVGYLFIFLIPVPNRYI